MKRKWNGENKKFGEFHTLFFTWRLAWIIIVTTINVSEKLIYPASRVILFNFISTGKLVFFHSERDNDSQNLMNILIYRYLVFGTERIFLLKFTFKTGVALTVSREFIFPLFTWKLGGGGEKRKTKQETSRPWIQITFFHSIKLACYKSKYIYNSKNKNFWHEEFLSPIYQENKHSIKFRKF